MAGRGTLGYEMAWKSFYIESNKLFDYSGDLQPLFGGMLIQSDTLDVEVSVSAGGAMAAGADEGVYRYAVGLTSIERMETYEATVPMQGIAFDGGFFVNIGTSPGVTVLYKGEHD